MSKHFRSALIALVLVMVVGIGANVWAGNDKDKPNAEKTSATTTVTKSGNMNQGGMSWSAMKPDDMNRQWTYMANLSSMKETYPDTTKAMGKVMLQVTDDGNKLHYIVMVNGMDSVTEAHIHIGAKGENGPPVLFLFKGPTTGMVSGTLAEGDVTSADLVGPLKGKTMKDLIADLKDGRAYIQIHDQAYPMGAIRGQIVMANKEGWNKEQKSTGMGY